MAKSTSPRFDPIQADALLRAGVAELSLHVNEGQIKTLLDYLALMAKWNPVYNLTAIRQTDEMVSTHLLDSLAIMPALQNWLSAKTQARILDVGSGGGLPGVVIAIMQPDWSITLVDPVHKKTAFLQQVKAQLNLANLTVVTGKVEDLDSSMRFDLITSRAFARIAHFVTLSAAVLAEDGCFAAMKGIMPQDELDELQQDAPTWQAEVLPLQVPQLAAQRHLVRLVRAFPQSPQQKGSL